MEELEKTDTVKKDKKEEKNVVKEIVGMILYVVAVFAVCFLIITYVGQRTKVEG